MANASAITVTTLTPDTAGIAVPTADVLDTGTAAVTLPAAVGGQSELVILEVTNNAASAVNLIYVLTIGATANRKANSRTAR